jgi:hypothetical protein
MNDLYHCKTLEELHLWLSTAGQGKATWLLSELDRLINYQNAIEWNQLVLVCEAIAVHGWLLPPFDQRTPVEAVCYKGMSGSFETALKTTSWEKQAGSWRDWSKKENSFVIYNGTDKTNYGIEKLNSQRNHLPTNPFKIAQWIANCQETVRPFVQEISRLRALLEANMQSSVYGDTFYYTDIRCSFSNHDDEHETVRTEYFHDENDVPQDCESSYVRVVPHIDYGKLSTRKDRLCWRVELYFTRAWGELPLAQQKALFAQDLRLVFAEFEARILKKKITYQAKQAVYDADKIIVKWLVG